MEWSTVWVLSKPLITKEIWPGKGLDPGLPNDTPVALYPLLHELMLKFLGLNYFPLPRYYRRGDWRVIIPRVNLGTQLGASSKIDLQ
jgi:hypothetical protein